MVLSVASKMPLKQLGLVKANTTRGIMILSITLRHKNSPACEPNIRLTRLCCASRPVSLRTKSFFANNAFTPSTSHATLNMVIPYDAASRAFALSFSRALTYPELTLMTTVCPSAMISSRTAVCCAYSATVNDDCATTIDAGALDR